MREVELQGKATWWLYNGAHTSISSMTCYSVFSNGVHASTYVLYISTFISYFVLTNDMLLQNDDKKLLMKIRRRHIWEIFMKLIMDCYIVLATIFLNLCIIMYCTVYINIQIKCWYLLKLSIITFNNFNDR